MAKVEMLKLTNWGDAKHPVRSFRPGDIVDIPDDVATRWISRRIAMSEAKIIPVVPKDEVEPPGKISRIPGTRDLIRS